VHRADWLARGVFTAWRDVFFAAAAEAVASAAAAATAEERDMRLEVTADAVGELRALRHNFGVYCARRAASASLSFLLVGCGAASSMGPGGPQDGPLAHRRGPLGFSLDRESAIGWIGNAPALRRSARTFGSAVRPAAAH
jgi:hypothetical protein